MERDFNTPVALARPQRIEAHHKQFQLNGGAWQTLIYEPPIHSLSRTAPKNDKRHQK